MAKRSPTVEVTFDPSCLTTDPFSIVPEKVQVVRGQDTVVEFVLKTAGHDRDVARFLPSGAISWQDGRLAEVTCSSCATRLQMRAVGLGPSGEQGRVPLSYHVHVQYEGQGYCSTGYPTYEEQDPIT